MIFSSLDQIVRRYLLDRQLPIHYYLEVLVHSASCLRELTFDSLKIVNTVELPVGDYFQLDLPDDFVDDVGVSIPVGQLLHPVPKNDSITPLRTHDSTGQFVPYAIQQNPDDVIVSQNVFGFNSNWLWFWNINDYGEPTGRYFGSRGGGKLNGYKLIRERRQIQLTETFTSQTAVLTYISDGQSSDSASQIDTYAIKTLHTYTDWQRSPNRAVKDSPEGRTFYNEKRLLRARLSEITVIDIRQIILKSYTATYKS